MKRTLLLLLATRAAVADNPANGRALFEQGIALYKGEKYTEAAAALNRSYELDAKPETLFALAQAERMAGRCSDAIAHYQRLRATTTDLPTARAVQNNLELCDPQVSSGTAKPRERATLATGLAAGGALGVGVAVGLYLMSNANHDASLRAKTYADYIALGDSASSERTASLLVGGAGVALLAGAIVLWTRHPDKPHAEVTLLHGGATLSVSTRF